MVILSVNETNELRSPDSKKKFDDTSNRDEISQEKTEKVDAKANLNVSEISKLQIINDFLKSAGKMFILSWLLVMMTNSL